MQADAGLVLQRERDFHNQRFCDGGEGRDAQTKYYAAIADCNRDYLKEVESRARGATVLEYGCGKGSMSCDLAPTAASVHGIDISDVAIDNAHARAASVGIRNVNFVAGDAHHTGYADGTFDLVFGSGIIHHLDTRDSLAEVRRVLKPGGTAVFREPLAGNPVFDLYRSLTPSARTDDEHPLTKVDLGIAEGMFERVDVNFYGLATLGVVPFRDTAVERPLHWLLRNIDQALFAVPGVKWWSWHVLMILSR